VAAVAPPGAALRAGGMMTNEAGTPVARQRVSREPVSGPSGPVSDERE
jgi:hypothetical protein